MKMKINRKTRDAILDVYRNNPAAALSTARRAQIELGRGGVDIPLQQIEAVLNTLPSYSRFRQKYRIRQSGDKGVIPGPLHLFQVDLCFMEPSHGFIGMLVW